MLLLFPYTKSSEITLCEMENEKFPPKKKSKRNKRKGFISDVVSSVQRIFFCTPKTLPSYLAIFIFIPFFFGEKYGLRQNTFNDFTFFYPFSVLFCLILPFLWWLHNKSVWQILLLIMIKLLSYSKRDEKKLWLLI